MKFSKNQIVVTLLINLFMFLTSAFGVIKWFDVSSSKVVASLFASLIFLFFLITVSRKHYKLFV